MSRTEQSVPDLIAEFAELSTALDLDYATEVATLRDFWAGPRVVLVTGPPRADRTRLTAALTEAVPSATVAEIDIAGVADRHRDVLVLATPADKLLPIEQQDLLKATAPDGGPILVAVTGLHRLGDERAQAATRAELEQLRLRPLLTPLGLRWWFTEPDDTSDGLGAEVARQCAVDELHSRQVRTALTALADGAIARCQPRVKDRETHLELLHRLRQQLGPAGSDAQDQVRTQALTARDVMSEMFERFYEEVGPARDRALAWLANDRITPWNDVVHPLQQSWSALVAGIGETPARQAAALHGELERIVRAESQLAARLGVTVEPLAFTDRIWADPASAEALGRLADIDLAPGLERFRQSITPKNAENEGENPDQGRPPNRVNQFVRRVGTEIDDRLRKPDPEQMATQFDAGLRTLIRPRSAAVVDTIQRLVETEGNVDATAVGAWLEATAKVVADEVEERHRWYDDYLKLVAFRDRR